MSGTVVIAPPTASRLRIRKWPSRPSSSEPVRFCVMTAPRPTSTSVDPQGPRGAPSWPLGCGPAWERPGARPAESGTPRPMNTSADPPRGCGPAWERPGARPAVAPSIVSSFGQQHRSEIGHARVEPQIALDVVQVRFHQLDGAARVAGFERIDDRDVLLVRMLGRMRAL